MRLFGCMYVHEASALDKISWMRTISSLPHVLHGPVNHHILETTHTSSLIMIRLSNRKSEEMCVHVYPEALILRVGEYPISAHYEPKQGSYKLCYVFKGF